MIKTDISICDNKLIESKFAYRIFKEKTNRLGNIISFISPVEITAKDSNAICADEAINFLWEIPDTTPTTAVCIQRLLSSTIGNILSNEKYLNAKVEIDRERIIIHKEHTQSGVIQLYGQGSIHDLNIINGTCVGYLGLYIKAGNKAPAFAFSTNLTKEISNYFMKDCIGEFYGMMQSIFLVTSGGFNV
jgi:hypothetical protein